MDLKSYISSLNKEQLASYASACGTTTNYMKVHIKYATKECRKKLRDALSKNSGGNVNSSDVLTHFGITD